MSKKTSNDTEPKRFPPVPAWIPSIALPIEMIIDRMQYYTNESVDFVVFQHGTCVVVKSGLSDRDAKLEAQSILNKVYYYHPDMNPQNMEDGNVVVFYNHPAYSIVLDEITREHWSEIEERHMDGLVYSESLMTPLGLNVFDELGKKALFGRCYMFMDAQDPKVIQIVRKTI